MRNIIVLIMSFVFLTANAASLSPRSFSAKKAPVIIERPSKNEIIEDITAQKFIDAIPSKFMPSEGQLWNSLQLSMVQQWATNFYGRKISFNSKVILIYPVSNKSENYTLLKFESDSQIHRGLYLKAYYETKFESSQTDNILTKKEKERYGVSGTLYEIFVTGPIQKAQTNDGKVYIVVRFRLKDCEFKE